MEIAYQLQKCLEIDDTLKIDLPKSVEPSGELVEEVSLDELQRKNDTARGFRRGDSTKKVLIFLGEYEFLSNLYPIEISHGQYVYDSAEHLYQTTRCAHKADRDKIRATRTAKSAKILERFLEERPGFDRLRTMEKVLKKKFRISEMRYLLMRTGEKELINQNMHHETYWGVCSCTNCNFAGSNHLGKLLMKIRDEFKEQWISKYMMTPPFNTIR